jgi:UDP-N-acetylmuramate--alanine ligase
MTIFADLRRIHFVGIGGAGTAPLAEIMLQLGYSVSGSDLCLNSKTEHLKQQGAKIFNGHSRENLPPETQLLVYSSAAADNNPELIRAKELNIICLRRGDFLAKLSSLYPRTVAISGSHGKTTITAMLAWILRQCDIPCTYLVGGKVNCFPEAATADSDIFITEVDESDGTNALFSPYIGLISNVEDDHSWSVGGTEALMNNFSSFAEQSQNLIYVRSENSVKLFKDHPNACSLNSNDLIQTKGIEFNGFMKINAALACCVAEELGVTPEMAVQAVNNFPGVERRMTLRFESPKITLIEDYAHHPTEVARSLELLRKNYPQHHLRVIFQPHRYARLAKYIDAFAHELALADSVFIAPVFAAWTENGEVNSQSLADHIGKKAVNLDLNWNEMPAIILKSCPEKLLLVVLGAGDIEKLIPELKLNLLKYKEVIHAGK